MRHRPWAHYPAGMRFRFHGDDLDPQHTVCVDGVCEAKLNLSHWPGNRTPTELRHDVSTGIALGMMADRSTRDRYLHSIEIVTNTHFDTDGVLSAFALLQPDLALAHRDLLIEAATTGDLQRFINEPALALDLSLTAIGAEAGASLTEPPATESDQQERRQRQYDAALDAVPELLRDPFCRRDSIEEEMSTILRELGERSKIEVEMEPDANLGILTSERPLHRVTVNTCAGDALRVLHRIPFGRGNLYRLHERVESWFDLVTVQAPERRPWTDLCDTLEALEAPESDAHWVSESMKSPVPELYFGESGEARSDPTALTSLCVSRLSPRIVTSAILDHYYL